MKFLSLCSAMLVVLGLSACASTNNSSLDGQQSSSGNTQAYGQIKGGVESSH